MAYRILCVALITALLPLGVNAQSSGSQRAVEKKVTDKAGERLSYTYVQAGFSAYSKVDSVGQGFNGDGNGYAVQGSYELTPTLHVLGDFNDSSLDADPSSVDGDGLQRYRGGIGLHSESGANADNSYFLNLTYERYDLDGVGAADGYGAEIGWRHGFTTGYLSRLEMDLSVQLIDLDDDQLLDNEITGRGQLLYDLTQRFAMFLSYEDNQILEEVQVGLRAYF